MQATQRRGLTGKARAHKQRNRAYRMYTQQMLEEYFDSEEPCERERPIPLRGRAEFLPTIDHWTQEDTSVETGHQLELTLQASSEFEQVQVQESVDQSPTIKVIPDPYWARPRASFQPAAGRDVDRPFDLRRFGYGCALGSAAAAAILLVVSVMFH